MALPNSWDVDNAIINLLLADAELKTLCPDGVFYDLAPPNAKRFVIVSLIDPTDRSVFGARAFEDNRYLVKAMGLATFNGAPYFTPANAKAAAYRIDSLLHDRPLTVAGYVFDAMHRDEAEARIRLSARDQVDASLIWNHGGAFYRVRVALPHA